jgi:hypothetical protein
MRISLRLAVALALSLVCARAQAGNLDEARQHFKAATAAYALGDYAEAADEYEAAFKLEPEPALLYNAAQARRLSGNKQRALLLYQNDLRVYGDKVPNKAEVNRHIAELKKAIETDERAAFNPPVDPAQPSSAKLDKTTDARVPGASTVATTTPPPSTAPSTIPAPEPTKAPEPVKPSPPAPTTSPATTATTTTTTTPAVATATATASDQPKRTKPWVWGLVAGAIVIVGVGVGVALSGTENPRASLGAVDFR